MTVQPQVRLASGLSESPYSNFVPPMTQFGKNYYSFQSSISTSHDVGATVNPSAPEQLTDAKIDQLFNELFSTPDPIIAQAKGNVEAPPVDLSNPMMMPAALPDASNTTGSSSETSNQPESPEESNNEWAMR
ncbi:hypothetical protein M408DRAFT_333953 [Serendipita vermifera MAFF 305830]|uniref:Uncharacterized protein n=1 Tax=Serendipita vermifera MAFF 305830 TaxID=933852 RepID=A0A0C3AKD9_SERVB|nr:hypothetical protein M408DRAFT_333953 [Serendipita vermifera MAFF 305830]